MAPIGAHATPTGDASNPMNAPPTVLSGHARLIEGALPVQATQEALAQEAGGRIGAIVSFTGVVRADLHATGLSVESLEFEVFRDMAELELATIREEAGARFQLDGLTILHRIDRLKIGDPIVLVSAGAPHRRDAFEAAAWAMDELKKRVPLWKRETCSDGSTRWVPAADCRCGL